MTPLQRIAGRRELAGRLRHVLLAAAEERHLRGGWVPGAGGKELGWVVYERGQMLTAVNAERQARDLPPVPVEDVMRVERRAEGHSDYVAQFAFGCAELVLRARESKDGTDD